MSKRKLWSWTAGQHGYAVHVYEREPGGVIYYRVARKVRHSLKHRDRDAAMKWAREQSERLATKEENITTPTPTVSRVLALYLSREMPRHSRSVRYQDERAAAMFTAFLGAGRDLSKLTYDEWSRFIEARKSGAIGPRGEPVDEADRQPVSQAVKADLEWLRFVIRWACAWRDPATNKLLMDNDPTREKIFREREDKTRVKNPRRPIATADRYDATMKHAPAVHAYLPEILQLANGTARRIRAILGLRYSDFELKATKDAPYGVIVWPASSDKMDKEWRMEMSAQVRKTVDGILGHRPGIGSAFLFPMPGNAEKPISYELASKLLRKAERLAKLPKLDGGLWHPYRRKWATERRHHPEQKDVAAVGGWSDPATMQRCYQGSDAATRLRVLSEAAELREEQA